MLGSSLVNTAAGLLSLLAGLASSIVVARLLGVEGAGAVAYALWIMTAATLISDLGIPQTLLRFAAQEAGERVGIAHALTRHFTAATALAAAAILAFAIWRRFAADAADAWMWAATAGLFLTYAWSTLALGAGQGLSRFRETSLATAAGSLVQPFAVALGALVLGPAGAILGHVMRHLPLAVITRRYVPAGPSAGVPPAVKAYARNTWLSGGLVALLGSRIELAVIGAWFGITEVGQYATGATMAGMIVQLSFSLAAVLVPMFAAHHDRGDLAALARSYRRSLTGLSLVLAPICFGGAVIAPVLVPALFGVDFAPAGGLAVVLVAFAFTQALTTVPYRMMLAQERSRAVLHLSIWEGVGCIALTLVAVPLWGAFGAAWAKGLTATASLLFCLFYCRIRLGVPFEPVALGKILLAAVLCSAAAATMLAWTPNLAGLALAIPAGAVAYGMSLALTAAVPREDRRMVADWVCPRLPPPLARTVLWVLRPE